jgi:hypothetical protein
MDFTQSEKNNEKIGMIGIGMMGHGIRSHY